MSKKAVALHIYDVGTNPEIEKLNKYLTAVGTGAFHGAVEVYGKEYSFGFCQQGSGIFDNKPKGCSMHHYRESIELGDTALSEAEVKKLVEEMKPEWQGNQYDLIRRNCVIFSADFAKKLGVKDVPAWVTNLAGAGATIQDGAMQAATAAQAAAIMAAAKAGEMNAKYDLSGQASAKIGDMITGAAALDEKYQLKDKAGKAADATVKGAQTAAQKAKELDEKYQLQQKAKDGAVKAGQMAAEGAKTAAAKAQELDEQYKIKENAARFVTKGGEMAAKGTKQAIFKVGELAEKHKVKEKFAELKDKSKLKMQELNETHHITEKMQANGCGACGDQCTVM